MRSRTRVLLVGLSLSFSLGLAARAGVARAYGDPAHDPIAAEALFERGKQMMDAGQIEDACRAFAESQRMDPAGGTLLRLALCHEKLGKLATAAFDFHEVVRVSQEAAGDPAKLAERVRIAEEHLQSIEPHVPKLMVSVAAASRLPGLVVTANGAPRNEETWGVAIPTDPGDVHVVASAPGHVAFQGIARLSDGESIAIDVPILASDGTGGAVGGGPGGSVADDGGHPPHSYLRPVGIAVGAAGVVALIVGSVFGVRAISKWSDANDACPGTSCSAPAVSSANDAKSAARVADFTLLGGAVAVGVAVVLWIAGGGNENAAAVVHSSGSLVPSATLRAASSNIGASGAGGPPSLAFTF